MWVKICANTNLEDALAAAEMGADAVGFVFAPSKRQVSVAQVREIARKLPASVGRVGVFVGEDVKAIARAAEESGLTAVQVHKGLDANGRARLTKRLGPGIEVIQVVHWSLSEEGVATRVRAQMAESADGARVLLDAKVGGESGGLGVSFDWTAAKDVLDAGRVRLIVAGGLRAENVAEAVRVLRPWGVDVASGVESSPGRKDLNKMRLFLEQARGG